MILLDTHILIWLALDEKKLSRPARLALKGQRLLADISLREVAALQRSGRVEIDGPLREWLSDAIEQLSIEVVPIDVSIAARSVRIAENFHGDPADQLIAATSIELDVPLVTADELLRRSSAIRTIW